MTREDIRKAMLAELLKVAPEAEADTIGPTEPLRDQLDLDSLDFLRFLVGLHRALGVEIPEADYGSLLTLDAGVDYLARRLETAGR